MSSRPSTLAPPRVPSRSASRAVIASGPAAPARGEERLLDLEAEVAALVRRRAVDAEPDTARPRRRDPASARRRRRAAGSTSGSGRRRRRCGRTSPRRRRRGGRSARTRRRRPSSRAARGTRPACSRTARGSSPPPRRSRPGACGAGARAAGRARPTPIISSFVTENGEHGATASWSMSPSVSAASRSVSASTSSIASTSSSGGSPPSDIAEVHRPARGDEPDAELAGCLDLRLDEPGATAREDVVVVEDRGAARQRQLGQARARGGVLGLGVDPRPHRIELAQPGEQIGLLRPGPGERLVQVVVRVDEPGRDERAGEVDALVGLGRRAPPPTASTRPSAITSHPPSCSAPASSIVATYAFTSTTRAMRATVSSAAVRLVAPDSIDLDALVGLFDEAASGSLTPPRPSPLRSPASASAPAPTCASTRCASPSSRRAAPVV